MMDTFLSLFDFILGVINLVLAHRAYERGNIRGMWINGVIGVICIFAAAL
jgi:hypothetical protein